MLERVRRRGGAGAHAELGEGVGQVPGHGLLAEHQLRGYGGVAPAGLTAREVEVLRLVAAGRKGGG